MEAAAGREADGERPDADDQGVLQITIMQLVSAEIAALQAAMTTTTAERETGRAAQTPFSTQAAQQLHAQRTQMQPDPGSPSLTGAPAPAPNSDSRQKSVAFEVNVRDAASGIKAPEAHPQRLYVDGEASMSRPGDDETAPDAQADGWLAGIGHDPLIARDRSDRAQEPNEARAAAPALPKEMPAPARISRMSMLVGDGTPNEKPVRVDVAQQGAGLRVTVRCADQALSTAMTEDLSTLLGSLREKEMDATANIPIATQRERVPESAPLGQSGWAWDRQHRHPDEEAGRRRRRQPSAAWEEFLNGASL